VGGGGADCLMGAGGGGGGGVAASGSVDREGKSVLTFRFYVFDEI
jgi:hypothetical protein